MAHRATTILDAVKTALTGLTTTGENVKVSRAFPTGTLPALSISKGADKVQKIISNAIVERELVVNVSIIVEGSADELDDQIGIIEAEIWRALMADYTLGLTYIVDLNPDGLGDLQISEETETPNGQADSVWRFIYRHSISDPEI